MATFKDHKITANQLLGVIPEGLLTHLSEKTKVDYYSKVLHGRKMFYLLMYGILSNDRLSQRTLEDTFNDSLFKTLFQLDEKERVGHSSICERLSKIDSSYFKDIYECIYQQFSDCYSSSQIKKYNLIRVDSSMVSEACGKLMEGIDNRSGKKAVKYSIAFDGLLPCDSVLFTHQKYGCEDNALPEVIRSHVKQDPFHHNVYVLDRGLQSCTTMSELDKESITFIVRIKENRRYVHIESLPAQTTDLAGLTLIKDSKVYLYSTELITNDKGNTYRKQVALQVPLRLVIAQSKTDTTQQYWFITNDCRMPAIQVCHNYRRRWDIEVFFRFIKQELNVSHLVSLNKNGIQVMLYMTLIVAMLVLIYKHANNIGYKTAKRRLTMEIRDLSIALIVIECGGDPNIYFKT